ncbi:MAG TPA: hypothetical protein VGV91_07110, partial [Rubrobacter sp.]|nr:hypothetical protein [Rubrobacter sp.]
IKSPRAFLASVVLVLALPVAILIQMLLGSGASLTLHLALTVGCALLSLSAFDFETPVWAAWIGRLAAGAFAAIFLLQAASELIRNDTLSYFALQVLGNWPERVLVTLLVLWLVAVLLSAGRGYGRVLGFVAMAVVVVVDAYNYVLLYRGEAPAFMALYLLPFVWLLLESRTTEPRRVRSAPAPGK